MRPNTVSLVPIDTAITPSRTSPVPIRLHGLSPDQTTTFAGGRLYRVRQYGASVPITVDDGTIAGSVLTMDRAFQILIGRVGLSPVDAVTLCATTPARELGLVGHGILAPEAAADLVVLDQNFTVVQTYVGGQLAYSRNTAAPGSV